MKKENIEQVNIYQLHLLIDKMGSMEDEINTRISEVVHIYHTVIHKFMRNKQAIR